MTTLALADREAVAGTVRFATATAAAGIRPVFDGAVALLTSSDPAAHARAWRRARDGAAVADHPARAERGQVGAAVPPGVRCARRGHCTRTPTRRMSANHWLVVRVLMSSSLWTEVSGVIARPGMALIA
jgi:hypothetical protein